MSKTIIESKTFWANIIGIVGILIQSQTGEVIDTNAQTAIPAVINIVLRLITKSEIRWTKPF